MRQTLFTCKLCNCILSPQKSHHNSHRLHSHSSLTSTVSELKSASKLKHISSVISVAVRLDKFVYL